MMRAWCLAAIAGCALTSKSEPRELRYFAPPAEPSPAFAGTTCARVRLGRIVADAGLRLPIRRRLSAVEVQPYETLRWSEPPEAYARRSLEHALFSRPLEQAPGDGALVLDVELVAFEQTTRPSGAVALRYTLRDESRVVARGDTRADRPAADATIEAVVTAIGTALDTASDELADRVVAAACPSATALR